MSKTAAAPYPLREPNVAVLRAPERKPGILAWTGDS
jgi:hypothetical protein